MKGFLSEVSDVADVRTMPFEAILNLIRANPEAYFWIMIVIAIVIGVAYRRISIEIPIPYFNEFVISGAIAVFAGGSYFFITQGFNAFTAAVASALIISAIVGKRGLSRVIDGL